MESRAIDALMEELRDRSTDAILSVKTVDDTFTSCKAAAGRQPKSVKVLQLLQRQCHVQQSPRLRHILLHF